MKVERPVRQDNALWRPRRSAGVEQLGWGALVEGERVWPFDASAGEQLFVRGADFYTLLQRRTHSLKLLHRWRELGLVNQDPRFRVAENLGKLGGRQPHVEIG